MKGNQRKAKEKGSTNKELSFDYRGILFAGMIIGALGAVMDVGMSIASAMEEVKKQISENCQLLHGTNSFKIKFDNIPISMIYLKK
ncbi:MAG: YibE/F family protein [Tepidanaerobacteraceae bacterium]|nr:YibE/F family protein [Tepidanaerobacteraceae bacterium]